jgi:hypothetical protein
MYSPFLKGLALQRVIATRDATVTDVVADFSRCCGENQKTAPGKMAGGCFLLL